MKEIDRKKNLFHYYVESSKCMEMKNILPHGFCGKSTKNNIGNGIRTIP